MENKKELEIVNLTVSELSDRLRARELSAAEVTEAYLGRIRATEPDVHAYITVTEETARRDAELADAVLSAEKGKSPVLCGIPYALKDNIATAGIKTTCASRMLENFIPTYSAGVYEKISKSGGVLLGKNNLDEFALGSSCEKSYFGSSRNPLDTERSPGGSSGGSAATVAAKSAPWSIGTDTGGSARQPAALCGVVSMKPTYGLVSRSGVVEFSSSLDTVSPITRDVYDNALVLGCIAGRDARDMTSLDSGEIYTDGIAGGVRDLKIGVFSGYENSCSSGCAYAVKRAGETLEKLGASLGEALLPTTDIILSAYLVISAAEASSNFARYDGLKYGYSAPGDSYADIMKNSRALGFGEEIKKRILAGGYALSSSDGEDYYRSAKSAQAELCRLIEYMWCRFDIIIMPTTEDVAFRLGSFDDDPAGMYKSDSFTTIANITGCPAITIPAGGDGKLPYGVTLMGKRRTEKKLYRAAYALEDALKGYIATEVAR